MLETKFVAPRVPAATVRRERLLRTLDRGAEGPLTLVAASAGAGKTALLSEWASQRSYPTAWLSLDSLDRDRGRFWRGVIEALQRAGLREPLASFEVQPVDDPLVVPAFLNALEQLEAPVVLVLDDLHELGDAPVMSDLDRLLRHPAGSLRLVLATRADPPLRIGRLRVAGDLTEVRATDLAFTEQETLELLDANGIDISDAVAHALWEHTEGWAAGVRLAALAMRNHADPEAFVAEFAGDDSAVVEYLFDEVLSQEPDDVREFLLDISPVERINDALANELTGRTDSARVLARLEREHAFLSSSGEERTWYRLHPLFAEMLRSELRLTDADRLPQQHARASAWLEAHDRPVEALRHVVAAKAWDRAAALVGEHWIDLFLRGEFELLRPGLEAMPEPLRQQDPEVALAVAGLHAGSGDEGAARPWFAIAEDARSRVPEARRVTFELALATVGLILGRLRGDVGGAVESAQALFEREGAHDQQTHNFRALRALALTELGIAELWGGHLPRAQRDLETARAAAVGEDRDWPAVVAMAYLSLLAAFDVRYARARRLATEAEALAHRRGWCATWPVGITATTLSVIAYNQGRIDEADEQQRRAGVRLSASQDRPLRAVDALQRARILAAQGQVETTLEALREAHAWLAGWPIMPAITGLIAGLEALMLATQGEPEQGLFALEAADGTEEAAVARARLHLRSEDPGSATQVLDPFLEEQGTLRCTHTESWIILALARDALADHAGAAEAVEKALEIAEPGGLQQPFLTHGAAIGPLLRRGRQFGTGHGALVDGVLASLERRDEAKPISSLADELSARETAVLRFLPTMMSNQEIANELFVSVNTVKTHLKSIYRKLDVDDRRSAVHRARELTLLGPLGR